MKYSIIIFLLVFVGCTSTHKLNCAIDDNQRNCLVQSPFKTAGSCNGYLDIQLRYRRQYIRQIERLKEIYPNDTIILSENYNFICVNCPSDYSTISVDSLLYIFELKPPVKEYKASVVQHSGPNSFYNEIRSNTGWFKNPEKYGTDNCLDGSHTLYTVFYPSGKMESMYMRCLTFDFK